MNEIFLQSFNSNRLLVMLDEFIQHRDNIKESELINENNIEKIVYAHDTVIRFIQEILEKRGVLELNRK